MSEPRAVVRNYAELIEAIRARKAELGMSDAALEDLAGLTPGYAGKLLGQAHTKKLGEMSFGAVIGALGLELDVRDDAVATLKMSGRFDRRDEKRVRMRGIARIRPATWLFTKRTAKKMQKKRDESLTPKQRSKLASLAARARWSKQ